MDSSFYSKKGKLKNNCKERHACRMDMVGLEATDESALSGHIASNSQSQSRTHSRIHSHSHSHSHSRTHSHPHSHSHSHSHSRRVTQSQLQSQSQSQSPSDASYYNYNRSECEKSTQTLHFACPRCSREFPSFRTSETHSISPSQSATGGDQMQVSSTRTADTGITMDMPMSMLAAADKMPRHFDKPSSHKSTHSSKVHKHQSHPKYVEKQPRCNHTPVSELPPDYHKHSASCKLRARLAKELHDQSLLASSMQNLSGKRSKYDSYSKGYASSTVTEPCVSSEHNLQKPMQSFRTVGTETSLHSIIEKGPKDTRNQIPNRSHNQVLYPLSESELCAPPAGRPMKRTCKHSRVIEQDDNIFELTQNSKQANDKRLHVHHYKPLRPLTPDPKSRHGHSTANNQLVRPIADSMVIYNANDTSLESIELRNKIADEVIYYKSLNDDMSTSSFSSSLMRSLNDDMARLFDLYTSGSSGSSQPTSDSMTESSTASYVQEHHQLPSLGLSSPVKPKEKVSSTTVQSEESSQDTECQGSSLVDLLQLTHQDLVDTQVAAPMIRRVQRIYRANLAEQMLLVQELDSIPKLVKEMLENQKKK